MKYKIILAFDNPYSGLKTYLNKRGEYQKDTIHVGEINTHIFQSGLIIRKTDKWCIVALKMVIH